MLDPEGKQLGILTKNEALKKAQDLQMDLIEIAPNSDPPVARILDFKKFRYEESKKERGTKKGTHIKELKELWLSPRIAEHDLKVRLNRATQFLNEGHKVKLTVKFRGREMAHPETGHVVLRKAVDFFTGKVSIDREAKFEGRNLSLILTKSRSVKNE